MVSELWQARSQLTAHPKLTNNMHFSSPPLAAAGLILVSLLMPTPVHGGHITYFPTTNCQAGKNHGIWVAAHSVGCTKAVVNSDGSPKVFGARTTPRLKLIEPECVFNMYSDTACKQLAHSFDSTTGSGKCLSIPKGWRSYDVLCPTGGRGPDSGRAGILGTPDEPVACGDGWEPMPPPANDSAPAFGGDLLPDADTTTEPSSQVARAIAIIRRRHDGAAGRLVKRALPFDILQDFITFFQAATRSQHGLGMTGGQFIDVDQVGYDDESIAGPPPAGTITQDAADVRNTVLERVPATGQTFQEVINTRGGVRYEVRIAGEGGFTARDVISSMGEDVFASMLAEAMLGMVDQDSDLVGFRVNTRNRLTGARITIGTIVVVVIFNR